MGTYLLNRSLVILAFSFLLASHLPAQRNNTTPVYPDRYRLNLPSAWLKRPKLVRIITDILPQTISQLTDRDFCTVCNAGYKVTLFTDSIQVFNEQTSAPSMRGRTGVFTYSFDYSFYAALLVSDSNGKPVSMLRLNDANEILTYSKQVGSGQQNAIYRYENVYDTTGTRVVARRIVEEAPPVITEVPDFDPGDILTTSFILDICERRIYEIEKFLRKLN